MHGGARLAEASGAATTRVVVFHAPGAAPARGLSEALDRRAGVQRIEVSHAWAALSGLMAAGAAHGVLVLHEPGGLAGVAALLEAVAKYAGKTKIWIFDSGAKPALRAATETDVALLRVPRGSVRGGPVPATSPVSGPATPAAALIGDLGASMHPPVRLPLMQPSSPTHYSANPQPAATLKLAQTASPETPSPISKQTSIKGPMLGVAASDHGPHQEITQPPPNVQSSPPPLLSPEELAMLLSDDHLNRT